KAEYKVERVDTESIRELLELSAYFSGIQPLDPEAQGAAVAEIQLNFVPAIAGIVQPCWIRFTIAGNAWAELDGGDFVFDAKDPQAVHHVVRVQVVESGQAVADLTGYIAAVEGRLAFNPNLKAWELTLELTGVVTPSEIVTPSMLKTITGSGVGTLVIDQTELVTRIRENEATFQSAQLVLKAETKIREVGPDALRELFAVYSTFTSGELQPDPQVAAVEDLQLDFEINLPGVVGPPCIRFLIRGDAWVPGDGGGFKIEQPDWGAGAIKVVVVQDGQVIADLTNDFASLEASLRHLPSVKSWELMLEIGGIIIPTDIHVPLLAPTAGARLATLAVGDGLEHFAAWLREAEATF
ncbi:MAG TPA: hypothetical protein VMM18_00370, partial [Gemmatimonadaceae bacterium]|nr:hypothetical protein [Gemmatimonadaceae bacterium]